MPSEQASQHMGKKKEIAKKTEQKLVINNKKTNKNQQYQTRLISDKLKNDKQINEEKNVH